MFLLKHFLIGFFFSLSPSPSLISCALQMVILVLFQYWTFERERERVNDCVNERKKYHLLNTSGGSNCENVGDGGWTAANGSSFLLSSIDLFPPCRGEGGGRRRLPCDLREAAQMTSNLSLLFLNIMDFLLPLTRSLARPVWASQVAHIGMIQWLVGLRSVRVCVCASASLSLHAIKLPGFLIENPCKF